MKTSNKILLIIMGGVLLLLFFVAMAQYSGRAYKIFKTDRLLFMALNKNVKNGDSYDRVMLILGKGRSENTGKRLLEILEKKKSPALYKQMISHYTVGIQEKDVFVNYKFGKSGGLDLQFRNGHLVNFNPQGYNAVNYKILKKSADLVIVQ